MRLGGFGYRQYLTRAAVLACAMLFVFAASASAATRYAVSSGGLPSGACDPGNECDLKTAIQGAGAGDTVYVAAGDFTVESAISGSDVDVVGQGPDDTRITGAPGLTGPVISLAGGATIGQLRVESANSHVALDLVGAADSIQAYSRTGTALKLGGGGDLNNSVVHSSGTSAVALEIGGGLLSTPTVRHSTIVATGSGSTAVDASGILAAPQVRSTIVNGVGADIEGALLYPVNIGNSMYRTLKSTYDTPASGNVNAAPTFEDAPARIFQQDPTSQSVNAGENSDGVAVDIDGNPRTIAEGTDIGAYELPIAPHVTTGAASSLTGTSATLAGTVNPRATATTYVFLYGTTSPPATATASTGAGADSAFGAAGASLTGLLPGTRYYYRVSATNTWGTRNGTIATFDTASIAPTASAGAPTSVTATSAQLPGAVNPGGASTAIKFLWGETNAYGSETATQTITGSSSAAVTPATLSGLKPGTEYHYRLTATNAIGTSTSDGTFTTATRAPVATAASPSAVSTSGATVNGTVDPGGASTTWGIEYGPGYGQVASGGTVTGTDPQSVSKALTGLLPGTTYPYRIVATNGDGTHRAGGSFDTQVALPTASLGGAERVTDRGARVGATVNPGGDAASYRFEYGTGGRYDQATSTHHLSDGTSDSGISRNLNGLEPGTVYNYRVVVTNSAGTTTSAGGTFATEAARSGGDGVDEPVGPVPAGGAVQADGLPVATPRPTAGRATNAAPAGGTVRVQVPGSSSFVELTEGAALPVGSVVDATEGEVTVTSAADLRGTPQSANFGGSEFKIQQKRARKPVTDIVMTGGDFTGCFPRGLSRQSADVFAAARRKWSRRRLWGNGHGRFRTRGRHGTATVRGTYWLTEDRCDGTLVRVRRGLVAVRDLERRRTVMVEAGEQYFARSLAGKKLSRKKR